MSSTTPDRIGFYRKRQQQFEEKARQLGRQLLWMSFFRLLIFVGIVWLAWRSLATGELAFILAALASLGIFLFLIRYYDKLQQEVRYYKALAQLNADEIIFLEGSSRHFANGAEFTDPHHAYSYDLDLFGDGGLYPYLNRCSTGFGKQALAKALLHPDTDAIPLRQEAIAELSRQPDFRQQLQAHGVLLDTKEKEMQQLRQWLRSPFTFSSAWSYRLLWIFPLASLACLAWYIISEKEAALNYFYMGFVLNLAVAFGFGRKITGQLSLSNSVTSVLQQFAGQFKQIESTPFQSPWLQQLQQRLQLKGLPSSRRIARLSSLFNYLETIVNLAVSILLNGLFLFHVHILYRLDQWKAQNADKVQDWLEALGEMEALNSFANLAFNNPGFCMPRLIEQEEWEAEDLGHPLISETKRIPNSISFSETKFIILTGSNMSGKSTFLRSIGINLVLARAGSVVCASKFSFYPYAIRVSMRITDSLQDSESFFYAELKRLQSIMHNLESGERTFILLDEILRGTNSHDKHKGTVGLIRKLVAAKATGIIATHDLTVADLEGQYPGYVKNFCFESNIVNDELLFDYRLKPGICSKLSASFLMEKMGIIGER